MKIIMLNVFGRKLRGNGLMSERTPGVYDFDVISDRLKEINKEREEMEKNQSETPVVNPPSSGGYGGEYIQNIILPCPTKTQLEAWRL